MIINIPRLELVPATAETTRMEMSEHVALESYLNAIVPAAWPPAGVRDALNFFAQELDARSEPDGWRAWYWLSKAEVEGRRVLVGSGGFKGLPDAQGCVEVGYGTLEEFQGRGYATEAVGGLVKWAWAQNSVSRVIAHASPDNPASRRVLEKCGFALVGAGAEPGLNLYEHRPELGSAG